MENEGFLIKSLAFESDQYLKESFHFEKIRFSLPRYEFSGWESENQEKVAIQKNLSAIYDKPKRKLSECFDEISDKKKVFSQSPDTSFSRLNNHKIFGQIEYKISKINLNDKQEFVKEKAKKKMGKKNYLPTIIKKKIASSILHHQKKNLHKKEKISFTKVNDVLKRLRPEVKNPVRSLVTPQLQSKSVLYQSFSRQKPKKYSDFMFLNNASPEPISIFRPYKRMYE